MKKSNIPWSNSEKYKNMWRYRNQKLFEFIKDININSFSEYGCGPKAPFNKILLENQYPAAILYDQYVWEDLNNNLIDFNTQFDILNKSPCGVLSGVFEYIKKDNLSYVLNKLKSSHDFLLFSLSKKREKQHIKSYSFKEYYQEIINLGNIINKSELVGESVFLLEFNK